MRNAVVYARLSVDRAGDHLGVQRQEEDARKLAEARGWSVVEVVVDNDTSAAGRVKRPGFERVLDMLKTGRADIVIAWALDRLTRNRPDTVRLIEAAQQANALVSLVRGSDLDMSTPAGRLTADLLAAVARSEIEVKSDRQRRATEQAVAQGRWVGGRRPFGYEADGVTLREPEAEALRQAYQMVLDGESLRNIARRWNDMGLTTPQRPRGAGAAESSPWQGAIVSRTLRNPRYAGLRTYKKEITGPAEWPAVVDAETWHSAQAVLRDPARRAPRGDRHLLTGLALCGVCGQAVWAGGSPRGASNYRCRSGKHVNRQRERVDAFVEAVVVQRLQADDARAMFATMAESVRPNVGATMAESTQVRQRLEGLAEAFADGAITATQLRKGSERLRARLVALEADLSIPDPALDELRAIVTSEDVKGSWEALSVATKGAVVDLLMVIHLDPPGPGNRDYAMEKVRINWKAAA